MLGLADRGLVFDLLEAVMAGQPRKALEITDLAHERGADMGLVLQDLLELLHTVTRLKAIPGAARQAGTAGIRAQPWRANWRTGCRSPRSGVPGRCC